MNRKQRFKCARIVHSLLDTIKSVVVLRHSGSGHGSWNLLRSV